MANTYTQIYLHVVFAVSGRACVIRPDRKEELQKYITGIVRQRKQKLIAINCMLDQTHILLGLKPDEAPSELTGRIKTGSTNHINEHDGSAAVFHGRKGLVHFPFPIRILSTVINYIRNQENHHRRKSFQEEYLEFLERHSVSYDKRYIFKPLE